MSYMDIEVSKMDFRILMLFPRNSGHALYIVAISPIVRLRGWLSVITRAMVDVVLAHPYFRSVLARGRRGDRWRAAADAVHHRSLELCFGEAGLHSGRPARGGCAARWR